MFDNGMPPMLGYRVYTAAKPCTATTKAYEIKSLRRLGIVMRRFAQGVVKTPCAFFLVTPS